MPVLRRLLLPAALLALLALAALLFSMRTDPHDLRDCGRCHRLFGPRASPGKALTAPVSLLCEPCHRKILTDGVLHPVDLRPRRVAVPADLPLSAEGELTCATCHDFHGTSETPWGEPSRYLRRTARGKEFCRLCHRGAGSPSQGHAGTMSSPHGPARFLAADAAQQIDPLSAGCIACHDGSVAGSAAIMAGVWSHGRDFLKYDAGSHPIGVDYEAARMKRGRKTDLRPLHHVDRRIRFFDGKVGCGSCHDPYSPIEKRLVMSDRESALCLACHLIGT